MSEKETILDDYAFLVSETDEKDFCNIAEYELEELIGQEHNIVRHKDMPKVAFKELWETVQKGEIWTGYVKNATKSGGFYWVFATVYPFLSCDGTNGYLSCRRKASKDEIEKISKLYKVWIEKEK